MSAKTTAEVNIVNADIFVQACIEAKVEVHQTENRVRMGNINGPYHNCELKYDGNKKSFVLEGDKEYVAGVMDKAMALYNMRQLQHDISESGRYQVMEDSITKMHNGNYTFRAVELDRG